MKTYKAEGWLRGTKMATVGRALHCLVSCAHSCDSNEKDIERSQRVFRAAAARVPDLTHARRGGESASEVEIILTKVRRTAAWTEREAQPPIGYTDLYDTQPPDHWPSHSRHPTYT